MIVGEAYGENEEAAHKRTGLVSPFVGKSGQLLDGMLKRAGIPRETCFVTNVVNRRPPENKLEGKNHAWWTDKKGKAEKFGCGHYAAGFFFNDHIREGLDQLEEAIQRERPECIIALGNLALWGLTRNHGIGNWRGSELWWQGPLADEAPSGNIDHSPLRSTGGLLESIAVVPLYHPAYIMRSWPWYATTMHDLKRRVVAKLDRPELREEPEYRFEHNPTQAEALRCLRTLGHNLGHFSHDISCDVETRRGRIACVGLGWSAMDAICIPLMHVDGTRWWPAEVEKELCEEVRRVMELPRVRLIGQNFNYDRQYFINDPAFGFTPRTGFDTMIAQHLLYPGTPKDLSHLSSMYCAHHRFWKDEGKEIADGVDELRWWWYNSMDCAKTWEVAQAQRPVLVKAGML